MLQLLFETNASETAQFFAAYCGNFTFIIFLACYFAVAVLPIGLNEKISRQAFWPKIRIPIALLSLCGCLLLGMDAYAIHQNSWLLKPFLGIRYLPVDNLVYSFRVQRFASDLPILVEATERLQTERGKADRTSANIVVVIGESFSKYHSSLYGYAVKTNRRLEARKRAGSLFVFSDAVSPWNSTAHVLKRIFSLKSEDTMSENEWGDAPLFPAVFRHFGYRTMLLSNQIVRKNGALDYQIAYYLDDDYLESQTFDLRNTDRYPYDGDLVEAYSDSIRREGYNLTIFHLKGQHIYARYDFPKEWTRFTPDSIGRTDLSMKCRQEIADYDNATRYNDYVVDEIIRLYEDREAVVVYLSDHGEEVYDYRNHIGRTHGSRLTPDFVKYQFEIPFMIWTSDEYRRKHPQIVRAIAQAVDRPFLSSELYQLLFDLAGIECRWADRTRSIIHDSFYPRPRLIRGEKSYEEIMSCPQ